MPFVLISSREFTHRVKSISMAKFTAQEVSALQEGGNQVWMCFCDKTCFWYLESLMLQFIMWFSIISNFCSVQKKFILKNGTHNVILFLIAGKHLLVSSCGNCRLHYSNLHSGASHVDRLRHFIKHVYIDRRFSGEKTNDKPPRVKVLKHLFSLDLSF